MKKPILSLDELKELGFAYLGKEPLDGGDFYRWWSLKKNDSEIHITYGFNANYEFTSGSFRLIKSSREPLHNPISCVIVLERA